MTIDHSVYPDVNPPPFDLLTDEDRADYVQRICAAFDFGIFPEESDWETFAGWQSIFDRYPIADSPGYHAFRHWYRWQPVAHEKRLALPSWKAADMREGRVDLCEEMV